MRSGTWRVLNRQAKRVYPQELRTGWKMAALDVQDTPECSTQNLAAQAVLMSRLSEETTSLQPNVTMRSSVQSKEKRKRPEEETKDSESNVFGQEALYC